MSIIHSFEGPQTFIVWFLVSLRPQEQFLQQFFELLEYNDIVSL